jgi:phytoene/squalene synthetase
MPDTPKESLTDLLRATSRSFYLTLRVLPARVRPQIGLAERIGFARESG